MTIVADNSTPTGLPAWVDLDEMVSPGLRAELAAVVAEVAELEAVVEPVARRAAEVVRRIEAAMPDDLVPDPYETFGDATGWRPAVEALMRCAAHLLVASGERPPHSPAWATDNT